MLSRTALVARRAAAAAPKGAQRWMGVWAQVPMGPADPILGLTVAYNQDPAKDKVSLGVGAYRDDQGKNYVLESVREAEKRVVEKKYDMEYAGIDGPASFTKLAKELVFGSDHPLIAQNRIVTVQSLSGTGALRIAGSFIERFTPEGTSKTIYMPTPTWANHKNIFNDSGLKCESYRHYNRDVNGLDFEGMIEDIRAAPDASVFLFHACAHNPTGIDPTIEQWKKISDACKEKKHVILFDSAYQGFASGDPVKDSASYRLFLDEGHQIMLCQSFAKNMGLYGQRTGAFHVTCADEDEAKRVLSQLKILIRPMYSNPPVHGARLVTEVLSSPELNQQWRGEVQKMADRINAMRQRLVEELSKAGSTKDWSHVTSQIGMFCYTGLSKEQVTRLREEQSIYMTLDGRISMAGLNSSNIEKVARGIHEVTK